MMIKMVLGIKYFLMLYVLVCDKFRESTGNLKSPTFMKKLNKKTVNLSKSFQLIVNMKKLISETTMFNFKIPVLYFDWNIMYLT